MNVFKLILLGIILYSCSNEDSLANIKNPNQDNNNNSTKLLSSVQSEHRTNTYSYNSDSSLKSIREESNGEKRSESKFIYKNGKIREKIYKDIYNPEAKIVIEYNEDLVVKQTFIQENEIVAIEEYFYDENNQMIKQIQKMEWNNEANKQTRIIDIQKVPGKNEVQLKYNGVLSFIITYDETKSPCAKIKGYSNLYATQFHGITNNILSYKKVYKNGKEDSETTKLTFDSNGKHLLKTTKTDNDQRLICTETYSYK